MIAIVIIAMSIIRLIIVMIIISSICIINTITATNLTLTFTPTLTLFPLGAYANDGEQAMLTRCSYDIFLSRGRLNPSWVVYGYLGDAFKL